MGLGFLLSSGVIAVQANNGYTAVRGAINSCTELFYPKGRCKPQIDTDALNGLMSEILCAIDKAGLGYDCTNLCQLAQAVPLLVTRCRSSLTLVASGSIAADLPGGVFPPVAQITPLLVDDTAAAAVANNGVAPMYAWDCRTGAYVLINPSVAASAATAASSCFTILGITVHPAAFVTSFLIDDTVAGAAGNGGVPPLWAWDCRILAYVQMNPNRSQRFTRSFLGSLIIGGNAANTTATAPLFFPASNCAYPNVILGTGPNLTPQVQADGYMDPNSWLRANIVDNTWGGAGWVDQPGPFIGSQMMTTLPFTGASAALMNGTGGATSDQTITLAGSQFSAGSDYNLLVQDSPTGIGASLALLGAPYNAFAGTWLTQYVYKAQNSPSQAGWFGQSSYVNVLAKTATSFRVQVPFALVNPTQPWAMALSIYG